ncbi:MAG: class IV adenylate cyclase [bacterium]
MTDSFKEIEIKMQLDETSMKKLTDWLEINAKDLGADSYTDYYLDNPDATFFYMAKGGVKDILQFIRIRFQKGKNIVCYKNRHITETGKTLYCDEYETGIDDGKIMMKIFNSLGYTDQTVLKKKRHTYEAGDFDIVIDDVEDLGMFVEVELKNQEKDGVKEIYNLLKQIGITKLKQFDRGYICMKVNPDIDLGEEVSL